MKKILVLNGSFCEMPIIEKAKEMGYHVTTTGNAPELMGHKYADAYLPCDYSDKEAVLQLVKENNIEGIVSCANDFGVLTAAYVAEQMGWKGHDSYETARLLHHKDEFKKYCYEHDIPSPYSKVFISPETALEYCKSCEYPIIVKANDLTGGKGISRADDLSQAELAIANAFSMSRDKHVLVEPYLTGEQGTFFAFVEEGKIAVMTGCTCYSQKNPYLIQAETFPGISYPQVKAELEEIAVRLIKDLDLADGIIAFQYIESNGKPYIIEMMRRSFGNQALLLCDMVTGFPWEEAYIRAALNLGYEDMKITAPPMKYCGHFGVMADQDGIVKDYEIPETIKKHLFKTIPMIERGGRIDNHMNERIIYLYYQYDDIKEINEAVVRFNDMIRIEME